MTPSPPEVGTTKLKQEIELMYEVYLFFKSFDQTRPDQTRPDQARRGEGGNNFQLDENVEIF